MTTTDRELVLEMFAAALELPPAEQSRYLSAAARDQPEIAGEVSLLLNLDRQAGDARFLESSALQVEAARLAGAPDARIGSHVGPFKLVGLIGAGGMGSIYLAQRDDDDYHRRVAIKLIKRGMDTDFVLDRFRNERQILADLNHPNIARFYTGGATDDGLPYFVMEYIEGESLLEYAAKRGLSINERLALFRKVCAAVQYAHQNLIVHRDLKPTNILVTPEGEPKLLDFGIAKLLNDSAPAATATLMRAMTPEYASPEQIKGAPVTTGSDVYSLGVLLYELLSGQRPYRVARRTPEEITKAICEQEPVRPSAVVRSEPPAVAGGPDLTGAGPTAARPLPQAVLTKSLRGDLDNIVLMALRKEPQRRYSSAAEFSEDIQRYLDGRPVSARRDTAWYRASKFVGRHRIGVAATAILLITLLGGTVGIAWEAHAARVERARAERRFQDVRKLAGSFMFDFHDAIKDLPGALNARQLVVKRALEYLDSLAQEANGDRALQSELAQAYEKVGSLTFDLQQSTDSHRKAMLLNEALVSADAQNMQYRLQLSQSYNQMSDTMKIAGHSSESIDYARKSLAILEWLAVEHPGDLDLKAALADRKLTLGVALADAGDFQGALDTDRAAINIQEQLVSADPQNKERLADLSDMQSHVANALAESGDFGDALEWHRKSFATTQDLFQADPASARYARSMWAAYLRTARLQLKTGDQHAAVASCARALQLLDRLSAADPKDIGHRVGMATSYQIYGDALEATGQEQEAAARYQLAISIGETLVAEDAARAEARNNLARAYAGRGRLWQHLGRTADAGSDLARAAALYQFSLDADPGNQRLRRELSQLAPRPESSK
ncbi:MAG TPA: serine/threonine-protein kinase [Pyrinomonadaceae bacterium]|nr:serine/threonine-protein kinase [Pyrinomonadaceae bacterium]